MKISRCLLFLLFILSSPNYSQYNYQQTIEDYLAIIEPIDTNLVLIKKSQYSDSVTKSVTKLEYTFQSQIWPKTSPKSEQKIWQHKVDIYLPKDLQHHTALLWVNGGTRYEPNKTPRTETRTYPLEFAKIAEQTKTLVIDLQDIPNQYLILGGKPRAEDGITAYTAAKFLTDPVNNKYYPVYLPMVKAVVKTMDNITANPEFKINNFIVSGLSKRGLTTWLTALQDSRVKAIIPAVIDILNTNQVIKHIFNTYQEWPIALKDYKENNILNKINNQNNNFLMQINDPLQYLSKYSPSKYSGKLSIDKYLILASGDDFFVPDSSKFYFNSLPGKKYLQFIPNSPHYINSKTLGEAILTYTYLINNPNKLSIPEITSNLILAQSTQHNTNNTYNFIITTNTKPEHLTLYTAHNQNKRDFRFSTGIKYKPLTLSPEAVNFDNKTTHYSYNIPITTPKYGWQASFVELEYKIDSIPNLKLTTPVEILPMNYPGKQHKPVIYDTAYSH
ncbi:MAG: hypothetical protein KBD64_07815 [Gammaproteobacteria bacterium]|nr:hypothetical protein [Gammaproteobacteria bacterium]